MILYKLEMKTSVRSIVCGDPAEMLSVTVFFGILVTILAFIGWVLAPFSPLITLVVAVVLTTMTFSSKATTAMSMVGIVLFTLSWPTLRIWGPAMSMGIWTSGVLLWFGAVYRSLTKKH